MEELSSSLVCSFCQEQLDKSLFDARDTVKSCSQCGSVLTEEQVFSYDLPISQNTSSKSYPTGTSNQGTASYERRPKVRPSLYTAGEIQLKAPLARCCEKMQLSKEITEQIQDFLLSKVNAHDKFLRMKKKIRVIGACIYIICRNNDLAVTLKQVAVATGCTSFELGHVAKLIDTRFGLSRSPVTVQSLITAGCSHLPMPKECEELAQGLCRRSRESLILNGTPVPLAIAHCVLASLAVNKGAKQYQEISKLCLKMLHVSESTVLHCIRELKNYMMTLLKAIPWVNMKYVKMANVHHYIKDIMKYEQNCGKLPAKVADPQWYHKRECEISLRKVKIQNALERILQRPRPTMCTTFQNGDSMPPIETTLDADSSNLNSSVASDAMLDEEDRVIEELLDLGCSPQQLQEGFYENLKMTSSMVSQEIEEAEIDSYVRKPDEVCQLKRILESDSEDDSDSETPKKALKS